MLSDWCPTLNGAASQAKLGLVSSASKTAAARDFGAVAANSNESAREIAEQVPAAIRSNNYWRFSSAVIASNVNKSMWPQSGLCTGEEDTHGIGLTDPRRVVSESHKFLDEYVSSGETVKGIALPSDAFPPFLETLARYEAKTKTSQFSSHLTDVKLLPPAARNVSFQEVVNAISKNDPLMSALESIDFTGVPVAADSASDDTGASPVLATVLNAAKRLRGISLTRCNALSITPQIVAAVKQGAVEHLSLEGNDLGLANGDADGAEEVRSAIADLFRSSKFLLSVDLAHNNFGGEAMSIFLNALAESDTKLTPGDLAEQRASNEDYNETGEPIPVEELVDRAVFFGEDGSDQGEDESGLDSALDTEEDVEAIDQYGEASDDDRDAEDDDFVDTVEENDEGDDDDDESGNQADDDDAEAGEEESVADDEASGTEGEEEEEGEPAFKPDPKEMRRIGRELRDVRRTEKSTRAALQEEYLAELVVVARELESIRTHYAEVVRKETEEYCQRRSGWSRLRCLTLRGNTLGDRGGRAVSKVLQSAVPLKEDELARTEDDLRTKISALVNELKASRQETAADEIRSRRVFSRQAGEEKKTFLRTARAASTRVTVAVPEADEEADDEDESDEYQSGAPQVVMTNIEVEEDEDGVDGDNANNGDDDDVQVEAEDIDWEEAATTVALPILPTKAGMNSIVFLDIGSCELGGGGLLAIAQALADNHTLKTLILRNNNKMGADTKKSSGGEATGTVSTGFASFSAMLHGNTTLQRLDLGFCGLGPQCLRVLASGLRGNSALISLNVEGNRFLLPARSGAPLTPSTDANTHHVDAASEEQGVEDDAEAPSALLDLLMAASEASALRRLNLSQNAIGESLWAEELAALAALTRSSLTHLYLTNTGLRPEHIMKWAAHLHEDGGTAVAAPSSSLAVLHLARNNLNGEEMGPCLADLLACCAALRELNVDENPRLTSTGLAAALAALPAGTPLSKLSCNSAGLSTATVAVVEVADTTTVEEKFVIPPQVMGSLAYLALGDLDISDAEPSAFQAWAMQIQSQCQRLCFLSLWSRRLCMEDALPSLDAVVDSVTSLQYADFGVLMRFDMAPDLKDSLGKMEKVLVARRVLAAAQAAQERLA